MTVQLVAQPKLCRDCVWHTSTILDDCCVCPRVSGYQDRAGSGDHISVRSARQLYCHGDFFEERPGSEPAEYVNRATVNRSPSRVTLFVPSDQPKWRAVVAVVLAFVIGWAAGALLMQAALRHGW